ncbi:hypothetical protein BSL78_16236 [Apostichopus japonicus]|uniref:Uncharacterized protein n=1 Tax=Stichopus japonicus TaxID=307972 RepID=A0A2G8KFY3_STIJA|nr:hypothetical protein BSL78_16236 [Apostichopus japonicus]
MRDENVKMSEAHENDHSLLDKVAFEALSGYRQKIVWKKEQLRKLFGEEFYNQYIRVGILVEDDVLDCDAGRAAEFHAQYIVERTDEGQKFAILCILEQEDNMQNLVEIVTKLVSNNVEIHQYDSRLLQRSTLQILEFASKKKIPITCLNLKQSYKKCEESNIVLHSGLTLTYLSTLENMQIEMEKDGERQEPKSLSEEEIKAIFKYVIRSRTFKKLSFQGCLLPITLSSDSIPAEMQFRDIKVFWNDYGYSLNLQSGVWESLKEKQVQKIAVSVHMVTFNDD